MERRVRVAGTIVISVTTLAFFSNIAYPLIEMSKTKPTYSLESTVRIARTVMGIHLRFDFFFVNAVSVAKKKINASTVRYLSQDSRKAAG